MKNFLHISGAIAIGIIGSAVLTFPWLIILSVLGYFYIREHLDES